MCSGHVDSALSQNRQQSRTRWVLRRCQVCRVLSTKTKCSESVSPDKLRVDKSNSHWYGRLLSHQNIFNSKDTLELHWGFIKKGDA